MKVMLVACEYPPFVGGGGRYVENLAKGLSDQGIEIVLLTSGINDEEINTDNSITIRRSTVLENLYAGKGNLFDGIELIIRNIQQEKPDIIHTHHSVESLIVQAANINHSIPHIITHHKTPEYRGSTYMNNSKWSLFEMVNKGSDTFFIAPSVAFQECLYQTGINPKQIELVYPGVDTSIYKRCEKSKIAETRNRLGITNNETLICIPAKVRKRKGIEFALESLSQLQLANKQLSVVVTGLTSDTNSKNQFESYQNLLHPHTLIMHNGFTDNEMPTLYSSSDLVLLTSEAEGLGIALLEAMACETPVVGTDVMGINEVIVNRKNGILIEYGNSEELCKVIEEVVNDKAFRGQLVHQALSTIKDKFSLNKQAIKHKKIYEELINPPNTQKITVNDTVEGLTQLREYNELVNDSSTVSIMTIGSISTDTFIPGWSDIDLLVLARDTDTSYLSKTGIIKAKLERYLNIKTGIEVVDFDQLLESVSNPELASNFIKFIKNFSGDQNIRSIFYLKEDTILPVFEDKIIQTLPVDTHAINTNNYMLSFLSNANSWSSKKAILRKIAKNSLFLMEMYCLVTLRVGRKDLDLERTFNLYQEKSGIDLHEFYDFYQNRSSWGRVLDKDIDLSKVENFWRTFSEIAKFNISSSHKKFQD